VITPAEVRAIVEPSVIALGCDLEDVEIRVAGRRQIVRVLIATDGGVNLDTVAQVSRAVSEALDVADSKLGFGAYVLEVSSPGIDRPLTEPRHFRRAINRRITATLRNGSSIDGRIMSVDGQSVTLAVKQRERMIALADIESAKVHVEFNQPKSKQANADDSVGDGGLLADSEFENVESDGDSAYAAADEDAYAADDHSESDDDDDDDDEDDSESDDDDDNDDDESDGEDHDDVESDGEDHDDVESDGDDGDDVDSAPAADDDNDEDVDVNHNSGTSTRSDITIASATVVGPHDTTKGIL